MIIRATIRIIVSFTVALLAAVTAFSSIAAIAEVALAADIEINPQMGGETISAVLVKARETFSAVTAQLSETIGPPVMYYQLSFLAASILVLIIQLKFAADFVRVRS